MNQLSLRKNWLKSWRPQENSDRFRRIFAFIPWIPLNWWVILLKSWWTSTSYFSNSIESSVTSGRFSLAVRCMRGALICNLSLPSTPWKRWVGLPLVGRVKEVDSLCHMSCEVRQKDIKFAMCLRKLHVNFQALSQMGRMLVGLSGPVIYTL